MICSGFSLEENHALNHACSSLDLKKKSACAFLVLNAAELTLFGHKNKNLGEF